MGRPIKDKFFGNTVSGQTGGEGIASIGIVSTGSGYSTTTSVTWVAGSPTVAGGTAASGTVTVNGSGAPTAFNVLVSGSGYTTTSTTLTITPNPTSTGTFLVSLTTGRQNAFNFTSWVPFASNGSVNSGGGFVTNGDIVKQEGVSRYYVRNSQGYGVCKLVASNSPAIGEMFLVATDANGSTYWVTRLTNRKARLTQRTMSGSYVYATGDQARWSLDAASGTDKTLSGTRVSVANV